MKVGHPQMHVVLKCGSELVFYGYHVKLQLPMGQPVSVKTEAEAQPTHVSSGLSFKKLLVSRLRARLLAICRRRLFPPEHPSIQ